MNEYNPALIRMIAKKIGTANRDLATAMKLAAEQADEMRQCGESEDAIADAFGVPVATVRSWLNQ